MNTEHRFLAELSRVQIALHLFAAFAEFERELIRERVISGIRAARINGKSLGRPKRLFQRDQTMEMRANGMNWRKIATALAVPMSHGYRCLPEQVDASN